MFIASYRGPSTVRTLSFDHYDSSVGLTAINALVLSKRGLGCGEANHVAQYNRSCKKKKKVLLLDSHLLNSNSDLRGKDCEYLGNQARDGTNKKKKRKKNQEISE